MTVADNLANKVFETLGSEIMSGELGPGTRLGEEALSARFGISRGPVREAIRRLQQKGFVAYAPNVGARVASFSPQDLISLYAVREALEGMAARHAAEAITDDELAELRRIQDDRESEAAGGGAYSVDADLDFHYRVAQASGNPFLTKFLCEDLYSLFRICRAQNARISGRHEEALREHRMVLSAMEARDPALAELAMRRHIANAREYFRVAIGDRDAPDPRGS